MKVFKAIIRKTGLLILSVVLFSCTQQLTTEKKTNLKKSSIKSSGNSLKTIETVSEFQQASDLAYQWLISQQVDSSNALYGLVDSFEDYWSEDNPKQIAYTYDQAIAAIAFLLKNDFTRAELVLDMLQNMQDSEGFWINSYWYNNGAGEEIRKHVGPVLWVAIAVMNYEKITGDTTKYHDMAIDSIDWCLEYQQSNGGIAGGETTWETGSYTLEPWSSTEHNEDAYQTLLYFASTTSKHEATYNQAAANVKSFLDNVAWDSSNNRFYGGFKNNTGLIDPNIPLDVNPWGVLALGTSGTHEYQNSIYYVENASGDPGTIDNPRYLYTLSYASTTITGYDFDWVGEVADVYDDNGNYIGQTGEDIWFEGTAFMSCAYRAMGDDTKADQILSEIVKKQGADGSLAGGIPYSLNGTSNSYWNMAQENCVSSTGWFIIAAAKWNPFTGSLCTDDVQDPENPEKPVDPLLIDDYNNTSQWYAGLNDLGNAIITNGGLYNLEGDKNVYFFYNGGSNPESFDNYINLDISDYETLYLIIKGGSGNEEDTVRIGLNDGTDHFVSLANYTTLTTNYNTVEIDLDDFNADLTNCTFLRIEGTGIAKVLRVDEIGLK